MKKRLALGSVSAAVVLVVAISLVALREREPVYQGRRVTEWIRERNLYLVYPLPWLAPNQENSDRWIQVNKALQGVGSDAIPYLVRALHHKDSPVKRAWIPFWKKLPPPIQRATAAWTLPVGSTRFNAAAILGDLGPIARPAIPDLVGALEDPVPEVRSAAFRALARAGTATDQFMPTLRLLLENPLTRSQTLRELTNFTPGGELTAAALVDVFNASNVSDQQQILYLLERIVWRARPAVNTLISSLAGSDHETRYLAVRALGAIGPAARSAVPALTARLNDVNNMVRLAAARALKNIDTETTVRPGTEP